MTRPSFFKVEYAINPWMDTTTVVDVENAIAQWENLRDTYRELGHTVDVVEPVDGLPDMVYAANAGLIVNGVAIVARFKYAERDGESAAYAAWMRQHGMQPHVTKSINEGQGDLLVVGSTVLAGHGFRTDPQAHAEVAEITGMPVISLELVDPRFYHLDTALTVLDDTTIAYYPRLHREGPRRAAAVVPRRDRGSQFGRPTSWGSNAVSDGKHVVHPQQATTFRRTALRRRIPPIGVDLSELPQRAADR